MVLILKRTVSNEKESKKIYDKNFMSCTSFGHYLDSNNFVLVYWQVCDRTLKLF
jgi:hypothetical protein